MRLALFLADAKNVCESSKARSSRIWKTCRISFFACAVILLPNVTCAVAQAPDHPTIQVRGRSYSPRLILERNMGTTEDQTTAFPPHNIIANIYYVGTRTLSSFLIV